LIIAPERHIYLRLITSPRVARLVGFGVYSMAVPKDAAFPFVVYKRAGVGRETSLGGPIFVPEVNLQFGCWARDTDAARELGDEMRLMLDGYIGTLANATIQDMRLISEVDDFLEPTVQGSQLPSAYEVRQMYRVRWQDAAV
jgi:hypothetical protein